MRPDIPILVQKQHSALIQKVSDGYTVHVGVLNSKTIGKFRGRKDAIKLVQKIGFGSFYFCVQRSRGKKLTLLYDKHPKDWKKVYRKNNILGPLR